MPFATVAVKIGDASLVDISNDFITKFRNIFCAYAKHACLSSIASIHVRALCGYASYYWIRG